jgi:hypothetical protein
MTYVIKVSKSGSNVLTDSNINNYIFDSQYNTFKIISTGTLSYTIPANSTSPVSKTMSLPNGNPYFVFSFIKWSDGLVTMPFGTKKGTGNGSNNIYNYSFYIYPTIGYAWVGWDFINLTSNSENVIIKYYICEVPANP